LATNTLAQIKFIEEHKNIGIISGQNSEELTNSIQKIISNITEIRKNKQTRFNYAQKLSWEHETEKLTEIWENIIL